MILIAVSLNLVLLCFVAYLFVTQGPPSKPDDVLLASLLIAAPISSLMALLVRGGESWLQMYLKRKKLEEKRKIEKLEASSQ
jgi:hypothetical protein